LPETEAERLKNLVQRAHNQGRQIRFWAIPDNERGWSAMRQAGVDFINTDRLAELRTFLQR
jgi:glycerophosphoryl diester phosphodiesterase